ncbi:GNAT family N-acetyltransferase [Rhodococcoides kyotonense]|uniref:Lysine N-acyltransferase MbtK n=1 Tax=Rhodococcoides kyotonense TaxID=398843 RepID=A0A239N4T8_9NOCA|nr:GNAT family N-acetyltransferase [Rhodococcus kyotonensis]SNT49188.1 Protein N-acetyltransferase, RimJ/RimL family [Rhodococcus kyotonensis]
MTETFPVLARELHDIADDVRAVPAPPIPAVPEPYAIRVAETTISSPDAPDTEMITEWMNRPHLAEAWEYDWPLERWHAHLQAQLDGQYSRPLIGSFKGKDIGYLEIYRAAKDQIAGVYPSDSYDIGMHAAIADSSVVNKGFGALLLPKIIKSVFDLDPNCRRIVFEPDYRNTAMRRLSEYAGGVFLGEHDMRADRRIALFVVPRTPGDLPDMS